MVYIRKVIYFIFGLFVVVFISGCSKDGDDIIINRVETKTINNTFYDSSKSFALQDFADSCSFVSSSNISDLNCSVGDSTFTRFNNVTGNWTMSCCAFKSSKCYWYNVSDILLFNETKQYADNILSTKYDAGYASMCCNSQKSQCFFQKPSLNGSFQSCGQEYDQIIVSLEYNSKSLNNWSVTSCLDGFR